MDATHVAMGTSYGGSNYGYIWEDGPEGNKDYEPVEDVPANANIIDNLCMASNYLMSHILHFYHLVALDYVDVNGTGLIPKGFTAPNYDNNYYARGIDPILQTSGLGQPAYSVNAYDYGTSTWKSTGGSNAMTGSGTIDWNPALGLAPALGDLTAYFAGQYVRALKARRQAHQLGALFAGKMPHASTFTPGCVTTKVYDPTPGGADAAVVQKVHELLYGGPGFDPTVGGTHPFNGQPLSMSMPHPESLMGFIGKPADFWTWAGSGFSPAHLPIWAAPGVSGAAGGTVPASSGCWHPGTGHTGSTFTGTYLFDAVAAAHVFPEYFWIGSGYGRYLAWGIFENAPPPLAATPDGRLITRGRTHITRIPNGDGTAYGYNHHPAYHMNAKEFTTNSQYYDPAGANNGRHMWDGRTQSIPMDHPWLATGQGGAKANAYTYAKTPRYYNNESSFAWETSGTTGHDNDKYLPYEVGPLARMLSNAVLIGGGPATTGQVVAVNNGQVGLYYPGILRDVDVVLGQVGVMPGFAGNASASGSSNLTAHLTWAVGAGVFYLPPNAVNAAVISNTFAWDYFGGATLDRIAARALEAYYVGAQMLSWFNGLQPPPANTGAIRAGEPGYNPSYPYDSRWQCYTRKFGDDKSKPAPYRSTGAGLTEAPRGALGHWITVNKAKVANYQIITPTTWNINPKDANDAGQKTLGLHGPIEYCIVGTPVVSEAEPLEILRVIHSFDPCCACTVHVMDAKKEKRAKVVVESIA